MKYKKSKPASTHIYITNTSNKDYIRKHLDCDKTTHTLLYHHMFVCNTRLKLYIIYKLYILQMSISESTIDIHY